MQGDARVIEYLNRGLRHELAAINQYWLHYRLLDNWGYRALAKKWRQESIEEMQHADKIVDRIIFLEGFPNMQVLDPLHIGQNVKQWQLNLVCLLAGLSLTLLSKSSELCNGHRNTSHGYFRHLWNASPVTGNKKRATHAVWCGRLPACGYNRVSPLAAHPG